LPSRARRKTPAADWNTALAQKFSRRKNKFPRNVENVTTRSSLAIARDWNDSWTRLRAISHDEHQTDNVGYARQLAEADAL